MEDVQNRPARVQIPIDRVGINNLRVPLEISEREGGSQSTVALAELGVNLPEDFKGTHMSRFIELIESFNDDLSYSSMKTLLEETKTRLKAQKAQVTFTFPFFIRKKAPATGVTSVQGYDCKLTGELESVKPVFILEVTAPVMTVCPCSQAISDEGAHSQRADVRIAVKIKGFNWLEEFIDIAEASGSSPTYPLLKRADEKFVTEAAFANPCFVEDVVRNVAERLSNHPQVLWYRVEVESYESIHGHNAFAWIERTVDQRKAS